MKTLDETIRNYRDGKINHDEFARYCHEWQTSAPRFSVQACFCEECQKTGPISDKENDYSPVTENMRGE